MSSAEAWYVAVDEVTAGPALTELVVRGIEHRKIPPEALVCKVGARKWDPLASVDAFHAAVVRSYPPPPPDSEEARQWMAHGFHFPKLGALPSFDDPSMEGAFDATPIAAPVRGTLAIEEPAIEEPAIDELAMEEILIEEAALTEPALAASLAAPAASQVARVEAPLEPSADDWDDDWDADGEHVDVELAAEPAADTVIDWRDPFEPFFLVDDAVDLPEEDAVLASLAVASRDTFHDDSALWNLALCLAYGSDAVGAAAARAFFDAVGDDKGPERIEWMRRALLGGGFVHSGIPEVAGARAVERLRSSCPPALSRRLS